MERMERESQHKIAYRQRESRRHAAQRRAAELCAAELCAAERRAAEHQDAGPSVTTHIFPQPEPDTPRIRTLPNTQPEPGIGDDDEPVTPVPTRKARTNHQGGDGSGPAANITTADLLHLEHRLLARRPQKL
jgi:hypothetical protein